MNKFVEPRPYADPEAAAKKLMEIANAVEPVRDGRIYIELINGPFLFEFKGTPAEYKAGLDLAIARGWLWKARERHVCEAHAVGGRPVRLRRRHHRRDSRVCQSPSGIAHTIAPASSVTTRTQFFAANSGRVSDTERASFKASI